jgi:RNA polymerase sigma-70 factor (ECF subfamily)
MEITRCIHESFLVREAQGGSHAAFTQLVHAHDRAVLKRAIRMTGSKSDAQDIYQEVFLKAYKKLPCFRFECSFSTWITRIVTNACLDHLRKRSNRRENSAVKVDTEGEEHNLLNEISEHRLTHNPEKEFLRNELNASILSALQRLSPRERIVFELKHFQGMTLRAVSEILNTSEGSVKTSLLRARRKLRFQLADFPQWRNSSLRRCRYDEGATVTLPPQRKKHRMATIT